MSRNLQETHGMIHDTKRTSTEAYSHGMVDVGLHLLEASVAIVVLFVPRKKER